VDVSLVIKHRLAELGLEQRDLARASGVSLPTIKRLEVIPGNLAAHSSTVTALRRAFEAVGIEFINSNASGVRLRADLKKKDPGNGPGP